MSKIVQHFQDLCVGQHDESKDLPPCQPSITCLHCSKLAVISYSTSSVERVHVCPDHQLLKSLRSKDRDLPLQPEVLQFSQAIYNAILLFFYKEKHLHTLFHKRDHNRDELDILYEFVSLFLDAAEYDVIMNLKTVIAQHVEVVRQNGLVALMLAFIYFYSFNKIESNSMFGTITIKRLWTLVYNAVYDHLLDDLAVCEDFALAARFHEDVHQVENLIVNLSKNVHVVKCVT